MPVEHTLVIAPGDDLVPSHGDERQEVVGALGVRVAALVATHVREVDARVEHRQRAVLHEQREGGLAMASIAVVSTVPSWKVRCRHSEHSARA